MSNIRYFDTPPPRPILPRCRPSAVAVPRFPANDAHGNAMALRQYRAIRPAPAADLVDYVAEYERQKDRDYWICGAVPAVAIADALIAALFW